MKTINMLMETYRVKLLRDVYKKSLISGRSRIYREGDVVLVVDVKESIYCALKDHYIPKAELGITYIKTVD